MLDVFWACMYAGNFGKSNNSLILPVRLALELRSRAGVMFAQR